MANIAINPSLQSTNNDNLNTNDSAIQNQSNKSEYLLNKLSAAYSSMSVKSNELSGRAVTFFETIVTSIKNDVSQKVGKYDNLLMEVNEKVNHLIEDFKTMYESTANKGYSLFKIAVKIVNKSILRSCYGGYAGAIVSGAIFLALVALLPVNSIFVIPAFFSVVGYGFISGMFMGTFLPVIINMGNLLLNMQESR